MTHQHRSAHFSWIRKPIAKTVEQAKLAMESYVSKRNDLTTPPPGAQAQWIARQKDAVEEAFETLATLISQIHCAISMVNSVGGVALSQELRIVFSNMRQKLLAPELEDRALVAVQNGLLMLSPYLKMVADGAPDSAGILAKYINEIREIRGVPLLIEESLTQSVADFAFFAPPYREADFDPKARGLIIAAAVTEFQRGFADFIANQSRDAIFSMRKVLRNLQQITHDIELGCAWWIGESLLEAVALGGIRSNASTMSNVRMLSVAIQKLAAGGEEAAKDAIGRDRFRGILYALSMSTKSSPDIEQALAAFGVGKSVDNDALSALQERLESSQAASIADVIHELHPLLDNSMVSLGRALSSKTEAGFEIQIQSFRTSMRSIANVFGMINEDELAGAANAILASTNGVASVEGFSPALVEQVKGQILYLDQRLESMDASEAAKILQIEGVSGDVIDTLVLESHREIVGIRQQIAIHVESGVEPEALRAGIERLNGTAAAFDFAGGVGIGNLLSGVTNALVGLIDHGRLVDSENLDLAARALVAIEMYLDALNEKLAPEARLLEEAALALKSLGVEVHTVMPVSKNMLLAKFEEAKKVLAPDYGTTDEDPMLVEIFDLRPSFEAILVNSDLSRRANYNALFEASARMSSAAFLSGYNSFAKLCKVLSDLARVAPSRVDDAKFDLKHCQELARSGAEMILRCMDEYSTRGEISLFTKDLTQQLKELVGHGAATNTPADDSIVEPSTDVSEEALAEDRPLPDGYDETLIGLFRQDFSEQYQKVMEFCSSADHVVTEALCLPIHTLNGICGSSGCTLLKSVFETLEQGLYTLKAHESELSPDDVEVLSDLMSEMAEYEADFPWVTESDRSQVWIELAKGIGAATQDQVRVAQHNPEPELAPAGKAVVERDVASATPAFDRVEAIASEKEIQSIVSAMAPPENLSHAEGFQAHSKTSSAGSVQPHPVEEVIAAVAGPTNEAHEAEPVSLEIEYDHEMASFFLDDAEEVLPALQVNVSSWMADMGNGDLVKEIKRNMHTLKGAAAICSANSIRDLTHYMESLFESLMHGTIQADQNCASVVGMVLSCIDSMTAAVRAGMAYERPAALIDFIAESMDLNQIDLSRLQEKLDSASVDAEVVTSELPVQEATAAAFIATVEKPHKSETAEGSPIFSTPLAPAEISVEVEDAQGAMPAISTGGQAADRPRTRRGGRGKRGRGNATSDAVSVDRSAIEAVNVTSVASECLDSVAQPADQSHAPANPAQEPVKPSDLPHQVAPLQEQVTAQADTMNPSRARLLARMEVDAKEDQGSKPITSEAVLGMLNRLHSQVANQQVQKKRTGSSEKIKVDQKLLETAVEQASELNAFRHRQQAQYEELVISLSALREKLSLQLVNHNKFTNALRGYIDRPSGGESEGDDEFKLERFNHLSSMHVHAGVQVEQMLQDVEEMFDLCRVIENSYSQQATLISSLQRDLLDSRLVPFINIRQALQSVVDQTSATLQKKVVAQFQGSDTIVDKVLLEGIRDPLTHILKNAIDHGLESTDERISKGKPAEGSITVSVHRRAKNVVISVKDDGRGIDPQVIRRKAIEKGIIKESDVLSDNDLVHLITSSGFTTTSKITTISGRGVGMDIVKAAVEAIGGLLKIESQVGVGTTFTMELPFTIGSNRAIVCQVGDQWFAIPCYTMTQIMEADRSEIDHQRRHLGHASVEYDGEEYEIVHLADLIAMPELKAHTARSGLATLILCSQAGTRIAIEVDKGSSMPEIHIRKLDGILAKLKGIIGETEILDGTPVLVLDVMEMARLNLKRTENGYQVRLNRIRTVRREEKPLAMIVDDATSYRKLLSKHFEARGFSVVLARDGQDALDMLPMEREPDVILVDVEMPRLDGLSLTAALRDRSEFKETPIIMLTTRTGLEDKAYKAGVSVFLNKPFDGLALDNAVAKVLPEHTLLGAL